MDRGPVMRPPQYPARRRATAAFAAAALLANTACFSYGPASVTAISPGADVRLALTGAGSAELAATLGPGIRIVVGQIQETFADTAASILIEDLETASGTSIPWAGRGRVTVPTRDVEQVQLRTLDRHKTWITGTTAAAVFTAVIVTALKRAKSDGTSKTPPGSGPPELRGTP